jgi:RND superfamily putative drug exporter
MSASKDEHGVAAWLIRHRWWVLAAWAAIVAVAAPLASRIERRLDVSARVDGSESARVDDMLRHRFASPFARFAVLVIRGIPTPATPAGDSVLRAVLADVKTVAGVTATASYRDAHDTVFVSPHSDATFALVGIDPGDSASDVMVPPLRAATQRIADQLRAQYPKVTLQWTGDLALNYDIRRASAAQGQAAERRVLPLTLVMLVVAFGAVVAALLPIIVAGTAIALAFGCALIVAEYMSLSILLQNIVTMLGLGLGIDYALLMVSRFREELASGKSAEAAAIHALRGAGHTVLLSAVAVLIGFAALVLIPLNELRAVAIGGGLVVAACALTAVLPLPALLAVLGRRVDVGRVRAVSRASMDASRWRRWAGWVARHPLAVLAAAGIPVLMLAAQTRRIDTTLPRIDWLPPGMESAQALSALGAMDRAGVVQTLRVVVELPERMSVIEPIGWQAVARATRALATDPRIASAQSLPVAAPFERPTLTAISLLPGDLIRTFTSRDQRAAVIELMPVSTRDFGSLTQLAREIRSRDASALTGVAGARLRVGGLPAFNADYEDAIAGRLWLVVALVVGGTLVALLIGFRSVLVPLKALVLNLASVAAALGAVVLVFQDGHGASLLGAPVMGSLFPALPALVFCIVFGLSMDYEVFLVARIVDARRSGMTEADAMAEGLARTGGVITSAAAIMIVVFAAFTLGEFLMVKVLGFALAVAVLLDATVVRLAIGPALLRLAGRWNWWPSKMPATDDARREDRRTGGKEDGQTVVVILSEAKDLLLDAPRRPWPPEKV